MRSFAVFLLGVVVGVVGMSFLPELTPRREQLNAELKKQIDALEQQVHDMGNQLKSLSSPKPGDEAGKQTPAGSAH
jgi:hypothetical protein